MIPIDFFGCKREQIVVCSLEDACARFRFTAISIPDGSALTSLSTALGGTAFSAERLALSAEPFYELCQGLTTVIREAEVEALKDAGARWAQLPPWSGRAANPMDLAGFLLDLHALLDGPENAENGIFLWLESGYLPVT